MPNAVQTTTELMVATANTASIAGVVGAFAPHLGGYLVAAWLSGIVVNLLTGHKAELLPWLAGHMDVNALDLTGCPPDLAADTEVSAAENVKRVVRNGEGQSPWHAAAFLEMKTVWHPIGV